jgi:hypothetical protein
MDSPQTKEKKQLYKSLHLTTKKENLKISIHNKRNDLLNSNLSLIKSQRESSKGFEFLGNNNTTYSNSSDIVSHKNTDERLISKKITLQSKFNKPFKIKNFHIKDKFISNPTSITFKDLVKHRTNKNNETKKEGTGEKYIPYINYSTDHHLNSQSKEKTTRTVIAHSNGSLEKKSKQRARLENKNEKEEIYYKLITKKIIEKEETKPKPKSTFIKYNCLASETMRRDYTTNNNNYTNESFSNINKIDTSEIVNFSKRRRIKNIFSKSLYNTKFAQNLTTHLFTDSQIKLNKKR